MKKKWMLMSMLGIMLLSGTACGTQNADNTQSIEEERLEKQEKMDIGIGESVRAEDDITDLTFADLAKRQFTFSSGVGGWATEFVIAPDGSFYGAYHDSDMGDTGEGYPNGTMYYSAFLGHFSELTRLDDNTYEMKLSDITYENTVGDTEIIDNVRYIYTEGYGLEGTGAFKIYLPGTPINKIPEEVYSWISMMNESESELTFIAIENEENGYGIFSYERQDAFTEASSLLENYKISNEEIQEKLSNAATQLEMNTYAEELYSNSDACLNAIWDVIRREQKEDTFETLLEEQRAWIADKEAQGDAIISEEGGSAGTMDYYVTLADLTMKRCEELVAYLK